MKLCIALDMPTMQDNLSLAHEVQQHFSNEEIWLKVGLRSFVRDGKDFVRILQDYYIHQCNQALYLEYHKFLNLKRF